MKKIWNKIKCWFGWHEWTFNCRECKAIYTKISCKECFFIPREKKEIWCKNCGKLK